MYEIYEQLLQEHGITNYKVSKDTGIAQSVLSSWKNGNSKPKPDKLKKIAEYFNVSIEYLMGGENPDAVKFGKDKIIRAYHTSQESTSGKKYYFDDEAAEIAQYLYENEGQRILFEASRGSRPEDLKMAADLLTRLKETNKDG